MNKKVLVIGAKRVGPFQDDQGRTIHGVNVHFIETESTETEDEFGFIPAKAWLSPDQYLAVAQNGTGIYEMVAEIEIKRNKPSIKVVGFKFVSKVDLNQVIHAGTK